MVHMEYDNKNLHIKLYLITKLFPIVLNGFTYIFWNKYEIQKALIHGVLNSWCHVLINGTKSRKDNQAERLNHLYKTKYTKLFW